MSLRMVRGCDLRLVVEPDSLTRTELGTRSGTVYFEIGDDFFPGRGWSDLAPDFANAWLHGVMRIVSGASTAETVFFMDGPYVVELTSRDTGLVDVRFFEDRPKGKIPRGFITFPAKELLENAIIVLQQMQQACQEKGWQVDPGAVSARLVEATELLNKLGNQT